MMYKNFSNLPVKEDRNSIFLAGPTYRDKEFVLGWRKTALEILERLGFNGTVYIPEYESGKPNDYYDVKNETLWEWQALATSGAIVFWIPRNLVELPGFTTNIEFGRYITLCPEKVLMGYPDGAPKMEYLDLLYRAEKHDKAPANDLEDLLEQAVDMLKENV